MHKRFQNNTVKTLVVILLIGISLFKCFNRISVKNRPSGDYDEQMWTGASIAAYSMAFKHYERKNVRIERLFKAYARHYHYDIHRMPFTELQWFDDAMWSVGWKAPNIAKYIMGYSIVKYGQNVDPEGYFYHDTGDPKTSKWPGNHAPPQCVELARAANAVLAFLTLMVVFLIGWRHFGFWVGFSACCYLLTNETFLGVHTAARVTGPSLFFSTATLYFCLLLMKKIYRVDQTTPIYLLATAIGVSFACAVGCKLNAALIGFVLIVLFVLLLMGLPWVSEYTQKERLYFFKNMLLAGGIICALTVGIFIYHNPGLHTDALFKIKIMFNHGTDYYRAFATAIQTSDIRDSWLRAFWLILKRNALRLDAPYYGTFGTLLPFKYNIMDGLLFVIGFIYLLRQSWQRLRSTSRFGKEIVILVWSVVFFWGITDFLWVDWARYHLPVYPVYAIVTSVGLIRTIPLLVDLAHRFKHEVPATA